MPADNQLQDAVTEKLNWEPSIVSGHIGVTAASGVVTLTGHVMSHAQKHAAETAARRVRGVRAVADEIEVRLPFETKRTDEDIAPARASLANLNGYDYTNTGEIIRRLADEYFAEFRATQPDPITAELAS